jgi:hypothetical protein
MTTKVVKIKGKILDEEGKVIPSAFVYLSDSKGNPINENAKTRANLDGEYSLPFSIPVPNITGKFTYFPISKHITFRTSGYPIRTLAFPERIINSSKSEEVLDVIMKPSSYQTTEVVISAKEQCEKSGRIWDDINKKCITPSEKIENNKKTENNKQNWWNKNKWFVIGGLLLITTVTTIVALKKK